jgi:hypothetical protein
MDNIVTRAKFCLVEVKQSSYNPTARTLVFEPRYTKSVEEDKRFSKATPSGKLEMTVDNPAVLKSFEGKIGQAYYLDFSEASNPNHE